MDCEISGLPESSCAHCRGLNDDVNATDLEARSRPFPARYAGRCAGCDDRIEVDDVIVQTDYGVAHSSHVG